MFSQDERRRDARPRVASVTWYDRLSLVTLGYAVLGSVRTPQLCLDQYTSVQLSTVRCSSFTFPESNLPMFLRNKHV